MMASDLNDLQEGPYWVCPIWCGRSCSPRRSNHPCGMAGCLVWPSKLGFTRDRDRCSRLSKPTTALVPLYMGVLQRVSSDVDALASSYRHRLVTAWPLLCR